jgi:hypothetical protein
MGPWSYLVRSNFPALPEADSRGKRGYLVPIPQYIVAGRRDIGTLAARIIMLAVRSGHTRKAHLDAKRPQARASRLPQCRARRPIGRCNMGPRLQR